MNLCTRLLLLLGLLLTAIPAGAWGLYTHVYFAQTLLMLPITLPLFGTAIRRFPDLVLAGSLLPDLALTSHLVDEPALGTTHNWPLARRLLEEAGSDQERALAMGFASHLLVDIYAHHHFVPEHERRWLDWPWVTHVACEWAMDAHVAPQLLAHPADLLEAYHEILAPWAAHSLGADLDKTARALRWLASGERLLRGARIAEVLLAAARCSNRQLPREFDHYISATTEQLLLLNRILHGDLPAWSPEVHRETGRKLQSQTLQPLQQRLALDIFAKPRLR